MSTLEEAGDHIITEKANWSFGGETAINFDSHVQKSVPLYTIGHHLIAEIADFFLSNGSRCYELGSSTGVLMQVLTQNNPNKKIKWIAIDQEEDMIKQAQNRFPSTPQITWMHSDILDVKFEPADLIIAYYTIQFIKPANRQIIINRIYEALNWGGGFIMFEKVRAADARFQDMMTGIYSDFKLDQGFTPDEIIAKSRSLKGVLEPFQHKEIWIY